MASALEWQPVTVAKLWMHVAQKVVRNWPPAVNFSTRVTTTDFSFPQQSRLKTPADYKKVFTNPTKSSDTYFTLLAVKNDFEYPRLGLVVAKKNIRKAVHRNRVKRVIRDNFRRHRHTMMNIDIVVLARKEALDVAPSLLQKSLEKHWLRLVSRCNSYSPPS